MDEETQKLKIDLANMKAKEMMEFLEPIFSSTEKDVVYAALIMVMINYFRGISKDYEEFRHNIKNWEDLLNSYCFTVTNLYE